MTGVLIPGHRHHVRTGQRLELLSCLPVLVGVALVGDIPGDHDDVEGCIVDFGDRVAKQRPVVTGAADVDVRELSDQHAGRGSLDVACLIVLRQTESRLHKQWPLCHRCRPSDGVWSELPDQ